jgi:VanZ family protein
MFLRYNIFAILWMVLILFLTLLPGNQLPKVNIESLLSIDKLAHAFVFSVLVLLLIVGFTKQHQFPKLRFNAIVYSFVTAALLGVTIEVLQIFITERGFEVYDIIANTTGCGIGIVMFYIIYKW